MALWIYYILFSITIKKGVADFGAKNADNYGPFTVEWEHFDTCRGPKPVSVFNSTTELIREKNGNYRGVTNLTMFEDAHVDEFRISVYTIKENKKTLMWNYIVNKPCQHYMFAALMENYVYTKNCWLKKKTYNFNLPLTELMKNYMGSSFFYGQFFFKAVAFSKKANLVCYTFDPMFKKLTKN